MSGCVCFIAQMSDAGAKSGQLLSEILPWLILLAGVVLAGGVLIYFIRRSLKSDSAGAATGGFTLQDLRDLHASGELSDEEFERAKAMMIGRARSAPAPSAPPPPSPGAGQ